MAFNPIISARLRLPRGKLKELRTKYDAFIYQVPRHPAIGHLKRLCVTLAIKYNQLIALCCSIANTVIDKTKVLIDSLELPKRLDQLKKRINKLAQTRQAQKLKQYGLLIRVDKPIGILLLLWPTLMSLWIAAGGWPDTRVLLVFVAGVFLMR